MSANPSLPFPQVAPALPVAIVPKLEAKKDLKAEPHGPKDSFRELVETIVFVTVLVLLLKSFVAEAFVIPTGSMAETLLGYRRFVTCPSCGYEFPVNCSNEVEPKGFQVSKVTGCTCPNCRYHDDWTKLIDVKVNGKVVDKRPDWGSGDRVLVAKWPFLEYSRWDVVVFKYPKTPVDLTVPTNYIKRLIGLPGETIAIKNGDLYVNRAPIDYEARQQPSEGRGHLDLWEKEYTYRHQADEAFKRGEFDILRKPPAQVMAMRRIVFDNNYQPASASRALRRVVTDNGNSSPRSDVETPHWVNKSGWTPNDPVASTKFSRNDDVKQDAWLRYRHLVVPPDVPKPGIEPQPEFIHNFMGYNFADGQGHEEDRSWVGDLIVECDVEVTAATGEFILELSKGKNRFQARFDLSSGECHLFACRPTATEELAKASTKLHGTGKHRVRFANVDERLIVWVDRQMPFGDGHDYANGDRSGQPDEVNDREPASIGVVGGARLQVSGLQLWRDTYYTQGDGQEQPAPRLGEAATYYVQPGHFLCLGDNSTQSADGRSWGLVPERLMQGRAMLVYFPFWPGAHRFGPIR